MCVTPTPETIAEAELLAYEINSNIDDCGCYARCHAAKEIIATALQSRDDEIARLKAEIEKVKSGELKKLNMKSAKEWAASYYSVDQSIAPVNMISFIQAIQLDAVSELTKLRALKESRK